MRYQIITYNEDTGADERREYSRKADAIRDAKARCYFSASGYGPDRGVIVYDLKARRIVFLIGDFPERSPPCRGGERMALLLILAFPLMVLIEIVKRSN